MNATDIEKKIEQLLSYLIVIQKVTGVGGPITATAAKALDEALLATIANAQGKLDPAAVLAKLAALDKTEESNIAAIDAEIATLPK